jgi:hypothetical protein
MVLLSSIIEQNLSKPASAEEYRIDDCWIATKAAKNSEQQRTVSLLFRLPNLRQPRISAANKISAAVNFREKQRKQRKSRDWERPPFS